MVEQAHKSFTTLEVWIKARELKNQIMQMVSTFPRDEKFRLSDQLIRASRSIATNIAEGHGRYTNKDQLHFCIVARGSLSETHNHLIDAHDCGYISQEQLNYFIGQISIVGKLLNGYIGFLRKNIK